MARLFSALVPPEPAIADLAAQVDAVAGSLPDLRWTAVRAWHVTLGFFGDGDDPTRRSAWLRRRVAGRLAPRLRLAGSGLFPGVLWIGAEPDQAGDGVALARLAQAAGAGRRNFHAHLTVARWRAPVDRAAVATTLSDYSGPWFAPDHVVLFRSDPGPGGPVYT